MIRHVGGFSPRCVLLSCRLNETVRFPVVFRPGAHQPHGGRGQRVQDGRRTVRDRQAEPDVVQGVPPEEVPGRGHVEERLALRPPLQLVQNPLSAPAPAAARSARAQRSVRRGRQR